MPKRLTLKDLEDAKKKWGFDWTWAPVHQLPEKEIRGKDHKAFFNVTCKCGEQSWVGWEALRSGRSKCCPPCSRAPSLEEMKAIAAKYGALWTPTTVFKMHPKIKRRLVRMQCKCKAWHWVHWNLFQQGQALSCRSCATKIARGTLNNKFGYKHPLHRAWKYLGLRKRLQGMHVTWTSFVEFKEWALANGYTDGARLMRKDSAHAAGLTPENCYWQNTTAVRGHVNSGRPIY